MTQTTEPLLIGQVISHPPVPGIVVRLQRVGPSAYVVTVEHTLLVDALRRSYPTETEARSYAKGLCLGLRAGWTLDRLVEILAIPATAA